MIIDNFLYHNSKNTLSLIQISESLQLKTLQHILAERLSHAHSETDLWVFLLWILQLKIRWQYYRQEHHY